MMNFAQRVRELRNRMGLTQGEFADVLGLTRNYVGLIEGGREPSEAVMRFIETLEDQWRNAEYMSGSARDRIQRAMRSRSMNFEKLHKLTGYKTGVLQAVIEGSGRASERMLERIGKVLGIEKDALIGGSDEAVGREVPHGTVGATPNVIPPPGMEVRYVPLLSMAQAGTMTDFSFTDEAYAGQGIIAFDVKDRNAFAVHIKGDSMEPKFYEGDAVIVSPARQPHHGDPVLAKLSEDEGGSVMFKLFTTKNAGKTVVLSSYNPLIGPLEVPREHLVWAYPVIQMTRKVANHNPHD